MSPNNNILLEEYKIGQEKVNSIENQVWKTATIFSVGSFAGIVILSKGDKLELSFLVSLLAIGILVTWWRIARRWWSIEQATLFRMRKIEEIIGFQINLIIENLDKKLRGKELSGDWKNFDFGELPKNHEFRGIQPMINFFIWINILSWLSFIFFQIIPNIKLTDITTHWLIAIIYVFFFILLFFKFYQK